MHVLEQYCPDKDIVDIILDLSDSWFDIYNACVAEYKFRCRRVCNECIRKHQIFHAHCDMRCVMVRKKMIDNYIKQSFGYPGCSICINFIKNTMLKILNNPKICNHYRIKPIIKYINR